MHAHPDTPPVAITGKKPLYRQLYFWVLVGIVAGILVGWLVRDSARFLASIWARTPCSLG